MEHRRHDSPDQALPKAAGQEALEILQAPTAEHIAIAARPNRAENFTNVDVLEINARCQSSLSKAILMPSLEVGKPTEREEVTID